MKTVITVSLILMSTAGLAQTAPKGQGDARPQVPAKPAKPVCRGESVTGSIFPARTCHSKEEWVAVDAANAANAEQMAASRNNARRSH